jgi:hypothetical protein
MAPNTYSNAPYLKGSSHSLNTAQNYVAQPKKSYLASLSDFQRGFPSVQTDPNYHQDFQSNQIPPSNPFNQHDDWKFRTEKNPTERSKSQFHAGFFDNKGLNNQPSIVPPNFERSEEADSVSFNSGNRLEMIIGPNDKQKDTISKTESSQFHRGFFADNKRLNIQPSIILPNSDHTEDIMRRPINTGSRLDMSVAQNEREQGKLIKSRNFEQALDLTSTTSLTQENHGSKSHMLPSGSSLANAGGVQTTFTFNKMTESLEEQRRKVARYFTLY